MATITEIDCERLTFADALDSLMHMPRRSLLPEETLCWAILLRAKLDIMCEYDPPYDYHIRHQREAIDWVDTNSALPFGFGWICQILDLQAGQIAAIIEMARRKSRTMLRDLDL